MRQVDALKFCAIWDVELEELISKLGERLKGLRKDRAYSQVDLSAKSGVPEETISKIENGRRPANLETLLKLADALEVDFKDLFDFYGF